MTRALYWLTADSHRDTLLSSSSGGTSTDRCPEYTLQGHGGLLSRGSRRAPPRGAICVPQVPCRLHPACLEHCLFPSRTEGGTSLPNIQ